jgi:hypothetical protein
MNKEILFTTAVDKSGNLIHIANAEKGINYYCPVCRKELILRKSGRTGKGSRRPHFAHNELTPNCTPEGVLHYSFKKMLINLLEKYKAENKPFIFNWDCSLCNYKNSGNLLEKATLIKEEYALGECRADIVLLDKEENVLAVIELVVTHKPEESVLQYYKEKKITFIQINLTSEEDLIKVEEKIKNPDIVDLCLSPKCQNRDKYKISRKVIFFPIRCRHCFNGKLGFEIEIDSVFCRRVSRDFTEDEMYLVKSKFNGIEIISNQDTKETYPISSCWNCQRIRSNYRRAPRL